MGMEETVFKNYGLLGLAVLALIIYGPRFFDRMTKYSVQHGETEDRKDEKVTDAFIDEIGQARVEREAMRQERLQLLSEREVLNKQYAQLNQTISAFNSFVTTSLTEIKETLKDVRTATQDFDKRMVLYLKSQEKHQ